MWLRIPSEDFVDWDIVDGLLRRRVDDKFFEMNSQFAVEEYRAVVAMIIATVKRIELAYDMLLFVECNTFDHGIWLLFVWGCFVIQSFTLSTHNCGLNKTNQILIILKLKSNFKNKFLFMSVCLRLFVCQNTV